MSLYNLLIISFLVVQGKAVELDYSQVAACDKIKFSYESFPVDSNGSGGRIVFRFEGSRTDYHIYMLNGKDKVLLPATRDEFNQLRQGKYTIVVTGKNEKQNYCPEFLEIEVR
jgi:hypothetical protein